MRSSKRGASTPPARARYSPDLACTIVACDAYSLRADEPILARFQGGGRGLEVYRRCMGEPTQKTAQDYLRPNTARDSRDDKVRMLRRSYAKASSRDELDLKDAADERDLLPKRREQETPPLKMDRTWQTFRSSKTTAFPKPPQEYILKDYMLRDVTHRVYEGPADNEMVQTNALYCSTAFINTDRPLAKPTTAPSEQMRQLKRDAARAPVPKGRRNLNSVEFLGALSHDFCPIAGHENATQPTDYSYTVWNGARTHFVPSYIVHI